MLARWVGAEARPRRATVAEVMTREAPMLESAIPSVVLVALAWLGILGTTLAVWVALIYGVVALTVWGALIARRSRLGPAGVAIVAGVNLALGLVIVLLKLLIH